MNVCQDLRQKKKWKKSWILNEVQFDQEYLGGRVAAILRSNHPSYGNVNQSNPIRPIRLPNDDNNNNMYNNNLNHNNISSSNSASLTVSSSYYSSSSPAELLDCDNCCKKIVDLWR